MNNPRTRLDEVIWWQAGASRRRLQAKGEVVVIMGPSGSGKTTLLRSLNFLEQPDSGSIRVCGTEVECFPDRELSRENRKRIAGIRQRSAMVFQSFNLFRIVRSSRT